MCSGSNHQKMSLFSDKKIAGLRYMTCSSMKTLRDELNLCDYSKVTVLNLCVIIMKPEVKLIISAARFYWS